MVVTSVWKKSLFRREIPFHFRLQMSFDDVNLGQKNYIVVR